MRGPLLAPGDVLEGKIEVVQLIGAGGMGAVYEARNRRTGRRVALKVLRAELAASAEAGQRFLQEALACGQIQHPNVVDIYDAGVHEDAPYLVMELLHGESLGARLDREGNLAPPVALEIVLQGARGVAAAHDAGIIHRDLKPDNLFVARSPGGALVVKVVDFGISKLAQPDLALASTQTGVVLGTPHYMAPEQARGIRDIDARVDVYALGAVLHHTLAGRPPFDADNYNALMVAILNDAPPALRALRPETPESLAALVARAMAKDRTERYQTANDLVAALEAERASLPAVVGTTASLSRAAVGAEDSTLLLSPATGPPRGRGRGRALLVAGAVVVGVLALSAAGVLVAGRPDSGSTSASASPDVAPPPATASAASPPILDAGAATGNSEAGAKTPPAATKEPKRRRPRGRDNPDDRGLL